MPGEDETLKARHGGLRERSVLVLLVSLLLVVRGGIGNGVTCRGNVDDAVLLGLSTRRDKSVSLAAEKKKETYAVLKPEEHDDAGSHDDGHCKGRSSQKGTRSAERRETH
jgi:hypothetical protein